MTEPSTPLAEWNRCTGVVYNDSQFHVLCLQHADKTGLCKKHRKIVAEEKATRPILP